MSRASQSFDSWPFKHFYWDTFIHSFWHFESGWHGFLVVNERIFLHWFWDLLLRINVNPLSRNITESLTYQASETLLVVQPKFGLGWWAMILSNLTGALPSNAWWGLAYDGCWCVHGRGWGLAGQLHMTSSWRQQSPSMARRDSTNIYHGLNHN